MSKENKHHIIVDDTELRLIVKGLVTLKENQIRENKNYEFIDDLIIKVCDATVKKSYGYER